MTSIEAAIQLKRIETPKLIEHIGAPIADAMMQNCKNVATKRACPHFAELKKILDSWWNGKALSQ